MDRSILTLAGYGRLIRAIRARVHSLHTLPMWQMDAALLVELLQGRSFIDRMTSDHLTIVHSALLERVAPDNLDLFDGATMQLQGLLDALHLDVPVPAFHQLPEYPVMSITVRDLVPLPGQVYLLWASHDLTRKLMNYSQHGVDWLVLHLPNHTIGTAGLLLAGVPFTLPGIRPGEIHSRWMVLLQDRVEIGEKMGDELVHIRMAPPNISRATAHSLIDELRPLQLPGRACERLFELAEYRPDLGAYTAMDWLFRPGRRHLRRAGYLLRENGDFHQHLRLLH